MKIPNLKFYGSVNELPPIDEVEPYSIYALNGNWEYLGKTDYEE